MESTPQQQPQQPQQDREPIMKFFTFEHLPEKLKAASRPFCDLAELVHSTAPRSAERSVALRKLLEAKDAAVRALLLVLVALAVLLAWPTAALAQTPAPAPATDAGAIFLQQAMVPIVGALITAIIAVLGFVATWLRNKSAQASTTTGAKVAETLGAKALEIMMASVRTTQVTVLEKLPGYVADGSISAAEAAELRQKTIDAFLAGLGDAFKTQLMGGLGLSDSGLTLYAGGLLEQALSTTKVDKAREMAIRANAEAAVAASNAAVATHKQTASEMLDNAAGKKAQVTG